MRNQKMYEADDKMISIINDDYSILQTLSAFGINMGFGDKTVREICKHEGVDTFTFLAVVNFSVNGCREADVIEHLSVPTLMHYLKASHEYFIDFELPFIRRELEEALGNTSSLDTLIMRLYDSYAHSIRNHMQYEEKTLFPFVEALLAGNITNKASLDTFSRHHTQTDQKLKELKNIIIKYLPQDDLSNNKLNATLYDIFNSERWLSLHVRVEEEMFIPAIRLLEEQCRQSDVSQRISTMINGGGEAQETLSERESEVVVCVVQGMSNKEIADHLCISTHTVITHRRNIAKKLQIHTPAGLTIYAIVNNMVDISNVKL